VSALLGVRVSGELRRIILAAGPLNAATRALIILGAAAAGQDVRSLWPLIGALIEAGELRGETVRALRALLDGAAITPAIRSDSGSDSSPPLAADLLIELLDDPLSGVGIEV
jgi:hypothetical protein